MSKLKCIVCNSLFLGALGKSTCSACHRALESKDLAELERLSLEAEQLNHSIKEIKSIQCALKNVNELSEEDISDLMRRLDNLKHPG